MKYAAALTEEVHREARDFLLRHISGGERQEDLCFALWRPSTGARRTSALVFELILPRDGERVLHQNASFDASYLSRAIRAAVRGRVGLAFLHSHLTPGWQEMSGPDIVAERDRISPPARATGLPAVGLTLGTDGAWSARFWLRQGGAFRREDCGAVRVAGGRLRITRHLRRFRQRRAHRSQQRTVSTWGEASQEALASLRVGVVGVGSVGSLVAETLARIGVRRIALFDADRVETENLDRLLHASERDVGRRKILVAAARLRQSATAADFRVETHCGRIEERSSYLAALDCDLLFQLTWASARCLDRCAVRPKTALGDAAPYPMLRETPRRPARLVALEDRAIRVRNFLRRIVGAKRTTR